MDATAARSARAQSAGGLRLRACRAHGSMRSGDKASVTLLAQRRERRCLQNKRLQLYGCELVCRVRHRANGCCGCAASHLTVWEGPGTAPTDPRPRSRLRAASSRMRARANTHPGALPRRRLPTLLWKAVGRTSAAAGAAGLAEGSAAMRPPRAQVALGAVGMRVTVVPAYGWQHYRRPAHPGTFWRRGRRPT